MTRAEREEQQRALECLRRDGRALAQAYRLPLRSIDAERANVKRRYGICYSDGSIRIRLRNVRSGALLKYSSMIDTVCHELAHLRYFDHGPRFQAFYEKILGYARRQGIYRPGGPRSRGPRPRRPPAVQGSLWSGSLPHSERLEPEPVLRGPARAQLELFPPAPGERGLP